MTTINDIADIARILREQPEWKDTIRGILLGQELLELPERLAEFVQITNRNFQLVYERLDRLETDLASLHVKVNRIEGKLDNALGLTYEFKVDKNIRSLVGNLNLRRTKVVKSSITGITREFEDLLDEAEDNGLITEEQSNEIMRADTVCIGRTRDNGSNQYVAGEISITVSNSDITRSARRAAILSSIIGQPAQPAVFGASIDDDRAALAASHGVTVLLLPTD